MKNIKTTSVEGERRSALPPLVLARALGGDKAWIRTNLASYRRKLDQLSADSWIAGQTAHLERCISELEAYLVG